MDETGFWVGMSRRLARSLEGNKDFAVKARYKGEKTLKAFVRLFGSRGVASLEKLIEAAVYLVEKTSLKNWFTKCSYCPN
jgi:hypothetical protein